MRHAPMHMQVEERAVGQVDRAIYRAYLDAWTAAWRWLPAAVLIGAFLERGLQVLYGVQQLCVVTIQAYRT